MSSDMSTATQRTSVHVKPRSAMMKEYLAREPETTTERLVAQSGDVFSTSTRTTAAEKASLMGAYLNQLVQQAHGSGSDRRSTSSTSTF